MRILLRVIGRLSAILQPADNHQVIELPLANPPRSSRWLVAGELVLLGGSATVVHPATAALSARATSAREVLRPVRPPTVAPGDQSSRPRGIQSNFRHLPTSENDLLAVGVRCIPSKCGCGTDEGGCKCGEACTCSLCAGSAPKSSEGATTAA